MITLGDIEVADKYKLVPQIEKTNIRLLWHCGYWDGPLSGMVLYGGELCWFKAVAEIGSHDGWYRRFAVVRLSAEQRAEEQRWHELFREKVGRHTDYDEQGQRPIGELQPREQWPAFYEAYRDRTPPDFSANQVIGWFEM